MIKQEKFLNSVIVYKLSVFMYYTNLGTDLAAMLICLAV